MAKGDNNYAASDFNFVAVRFSDSRLNSFRL